MAEPTPTPAPVVKPEPTPASAPPATPPVGGDTPNSAIPYERFKEVNEAKKALELKLQGITDAQKLAADEKLKADGKL